jgi:hypothetical protein
MHYDEHQRPNTVVTRDFGIAQSTDGGQTFLPYEVIGRLRSERLEINRDPLLWQSMPTVAVGPRGGKFTDRLYAAWISADGPSHKLLFSYSGDRGQTWSEPRAIEGCLSNKYSARVPRQAYPMMAVNKDGIVGVAWYGRCDDTSAQSYDIYFTASPDGGHNWLPTVRVSSETSYPARGGNLAAILVPATRESGPGHIFLRSPYTARPLGGDYVTMAVDAEGRFHPLWNDTRNGAWQLYTSTIHVIAEGSIKERVDRIYPAGENSSKTCSLDDKVALLGGDSRWNTSTGDASIFLRLENISQAVLVGKVILQIESQTSASILDVELRDPFTGRFENHTRVSYTIPADRPLLPGSVSPELPVRVRGRNPLGMGGYVKYEIEGVCPDSHLAQTP